MKCLRLIDSSDGTMIQADDCTPQEEAQCVAFMGKYKVIYESSTRGLYGMEQEEVTLSYDQKDYTNEQLICVFRQGELVGCRVKDKDFFLHGQHEYRQTIDRGPQGPLIWDTVVWKLVER